MVLEVVGDVVVGVDGLGCVGVFGLGLGLGLGLERSDGECEGRGEE